MDRIIWEEASPAIAAAADGLMPRDVKHVNRRLKDTQPDLVVTFGVSAAQVLRASTWSGVTINAPHPAARFADIKKRLRSAAEQLEALMLAGRSRQRRMRENENESQ